MHVAFFWSWCVLAGASLAGALSAEHLTIGLVFYAVNAALAVRQWYEITRLCA